MNAWENARAMVDLEAGCGGMIACESRWFALGQLGCVVITLANKGGR